MSLPSMFQEIASKTLGSIDATIFLLIIGTVVMTACVLLADIYRSK